LGPFALMELIINWNQSSLSFCNAKKCNFWVPFLGSRPPLSACRRKYCAIMVFGVVDSFGLVKKLDFLFIRWERASEGRREGGKEAGPDKEMLYMLM
jgi:hypothetical protein